MIMLVSRNAYIADGLGERIRRLRKERGWTQTDLAERVGCSRRAIVYYERDGKYPPAPIAAAMAGAFGIDLGTFIEPDEPQNRSSRDEPNLLNPDERRLWKKFRVLLDLNERDRSAVFRMVEGLVAKGGR
jgi:transcriptional regulator with XRE-family HTH domain